MSDDTNKTEDLVLGGLMSLYDAKSDDVKSSAPELLPIYSELHPEPEHYTQQTLLARGGMKTVLKVFDPKTTRYVAMAKLNADSPEELYEPFLREARLSALLDHPNIITIHDIGLSADSTPFFTMELKSGQSLDELIHEIRTDCDAAPTAEKLQQATNRLLNIFLKICDAIGYAHSQNVLHLDLKPENIQVGLHGEVTVCDWGIGKLIGNKDYDGGEFDRLLLNPDLLNNMTLSGQIKGTLGYMAPEQISNTADKTFQTDIYALGAILYTILTDHAPIDGDTSETMITQTLNGQILAPGERFPEKHPQPALAAIAMKALSVAPDQRYATVKALRDDVVSYINGYSTAAEEAGLLTEIRLFYRRQRLVVNLCGLFLLTFIVALTYSFISIRQSEQSAVTALTQLQEEKAERLRLGREAAPSYFEKGHTEFSKGHLGAAFKHIKTATVLDPEFREANNLLAALYFLNNEYTEADQAFQRPLPPFFRKIDALNKAHQEGFQTTEEEFERTQELLQSSKKVIQTPLTTALFLHWAFDEREAYSQLALETIVIPKEMCFTVLNTIAAREHSPVTEALIAQILQTLQDAPDWSGRRIPATLGMSLTQNEAIRAQFKALIPDNLALGQPVETTGENSGNPALTVDGKITAKSYWSASPYPVNLRIDLGDLHTISRIEIHTSTLNFNKQKFKYGISVSTGRPHTTPVAELSHKDDFNPTHQVYEIVPQTARFVIFKMNYNTGDIPIQIKEIKVY